MAYKSLLHSVILTLIMLIVLHSSNEIDWSSDDEDMPYINLPDTDCKPEISAVLLECPKDVPLNENSEQGLDKSEGKACETQMMVNVRVNPSFHLKKLDKFLILDEVYDPRRRTKAKIMSPYLIELSRGEPIMMYPLKFAKNVHAQNGENAENSEKGESAENEENDKNCNTNNESHNSNNESGNTNNESDNSNNESGDTNNDSDNSNNESGDTNNDSDNSNNESDNSKNESCDTNNESSNTNNESDNSNNESGSTNNESCDENESNSIDTYLDTHHESTNDNDNCQSSTVQEEQTCETITQSCETTTEACTTEKPKPSTPKNMCGSDGLNEAEDQSYKRVLQKLHHAFKLVPKGHNYNRYNPSDKKPIAGADEFGYGQLSVQNKYPSIWTNNRILKVKKPLLNDHRRPVFKKIFMNSFYPKKLVDEIPENVDAEDTFGKRFEGKRVAQLGILTPVQPLTKSNEMEQDHNYINFVTEEEYTDENSHYHLNNVDNADKYTNDENHIILTKIDVTPNADNKDKGKMISTSDHGIEKRTPKDKIFRKQARSRKMHRKYRKNNKTKKHGSLAIDNEKNFDKKTEFKSCECKPTRNFAISLKENIKGIDALDAKHIGDDIMDNNDRYISYPVDDNLYGTKSIRNFKRTDLNKVRRHRKFGKSQRIQKNAYDKQLKGDMTNLGKFQQHNLDISDDMSNRQRRLQLMDNLRQHRKMLDKDVLSIEDPLYYNPYGDIYTKYSSDDPRRDKNLIAAMKYHNEELFQPLRLKTFLENPGVTKKYHKTQSDKMANTWYNINKILADIDMSHDKFPVKKDNLVTNTTEEQLSLMFSDPNLNMNDKMEILDAISGRVNKVNFFNTPNDLKRAQQNSATPIPYPLKKRGKNPTLSKHKRSFLFYDDMEIPENSLETQTYDDKLPALSNNIVKDDLSIDDGIQPCATCGGKGRKMKPPKADADIAPEDNYLNCDCSNIIQNKCTCNKRDSSIDDTWYSVYNMSAPLPYLTTIVKIFRKRHGTWWRIVPSITLSSLSGIFANANLSVLFSSHVDIFQFEKSLKLQNNQILVPKGDRYIRDLKNFHADIHLDENIDTNLDYNLNVNPEKMWAINPAKLNSDNLIIPKRATNQQTHGQNKRHSHNYHTRKHVSNTVWNGFIDPFRAFRTAESHSDTGVKRLLDLGYFPTSMNVLQRCPNDKHRLCLNMLDNRVPAFNVKIKMPFRENGLIYENHQMVKIVKIITDATTKDALQVTVDIINEGPKVREVSVCICNCPTPCAAAAKTTVQKTLLPHYQQTVSFLLPFIMENNNMKHKKFHCNAIIKVAIPPKVSLDDGNNENNNENEKNGKYKNGECNAHNNKNKNNENNRNDEKNEMSINSTHDITVNVKKRFSSIEPEQKIIAKRRLDVEPEARCLCVWKCRCHCIPKMETNVDFHVCHEMDEKSQRNAGFLDNEDNEHNMEEGESPEKQITTPMPESPSTSYDIEYGGFLWNALLLLLLMLLLGLLKAILGLCIRSIDKWGYNYVQPGRQYRCASRPRRFCVNALFFIIFPFLFWCTCFTPNEADLLVASTEWACSHGPNKRNRYAECKYSETDGDDEDVILSQHLDLNTNRPNDVRIRGGSDIPSIPCMSEFEFNDDIFDIEFDDDDEANTKFVLKALAESRESLRRLHKENDSNSKLEMINEEIVNEDTKEADELVSKLKAAQIVYRVFDQPIGDVQHIPIGFKYCIQGYFLPCIGVGYEFVNYNPLAQHRCPSIDGRTMLALRPPILLCPKDFGRRYNDKYDVFKAADLTVYPPQGVPCINISTIALVASSVVKLASDHSADSLRKRDSIRPLKSSQTPNDVSHLTTTTTFDINICSPATNFSEGQNSSERTSRRTQWTSDSFLRTEVDAINDDFLLHEFDMAQEQRNFFQHRNMDTILE